MTPKQRFILAVQGKQTDRPALGSVTSVATTEAMIAVNSAFPHAHHDHTTMAKLASFASIDAGFDMICPLFSVVHEAAALGAGINWGDEYNMPGIIHHPWSTPEDINIPDNFEQRDSMHVPLKALKLLKDEYKDEYALVGKIFGPWSLTFHMFGVEETLIMVLDNPDKLAEILNIMSQVSLRSAIAQINAGADLLCIADHCSRDMCSPQTYYDFLLPLHKELAKSIPCPMVLHTCGDTSDRINFIADSGISCFHYDTRVPAGMASKLAGGKISLMGGVSNINSLLPNDESAIRADVIRAINAGINVIGPECAIPLSTSTASLRNIKKTLSEELPNKI